LSSAQSACPTPAPAPYRGRFAPSPTGPLHLGSLLAALGSYLDARAHGGLWLVRLEDIDPPRESRGASKAILGSLAAHGLESDEPVLFQSTRSVAYEGAVARLLGSGDAFYCTCSRQELASSDGRHASHCPGTSEAPGRPAAVRFRVSNHTPLHDDFLLGRVHRPTEDSAFVIQRKDGLFAYHLAVVVDDAFQQITHVVRGRDLLDATPLHIALQQRLELPTPAYGHLPLLLSSDGQKLSKQNLARPLDDQRADDNLRLCLKALGQPDPPRVPRSALLQWAAEHWARECVPRHDTLMAAG